MDQQEIIDRINTEYRDGGYGLGWRLLMGPSRTLNGSSVAFIGLNPGGSYVDAAHGEFSVESGSAYIVESWADHPPGTSPLQRQVRSLFGQLSVEPANVLAGNLIPFRSPSFKELPNRKRAINFGTSLWRDIFSTANPNLVITMSNQTTKSVAKLLDAGPEHRVPLGWGTISGTRRAYDGGTLVGLPVLSRFRVIGREKSAAGIAALFDGVSIGAQVR